MRGSVWGHSPWPLGLGLGLMVILPTLFILMVTLPQGSVRVREFMRFYETKWGIGIRGLRWIYVPIAMLGLVSLTMLMVST